MQRYGLIGEHLSHSFSARFFNAKFCAEGIDALYELFELGAIAEINTLIAQHGLRGFNVTIPYKESILPYLDELSEEAREVGAVNCVSINGDKKIGHNTDIAGIEASLHWLNLSSDTKALILGTGGASKAVQYVLRKLGIEYKSVSRTPERGDITYDNLTAKQIKEHHLIVNTTPVGMFPNVDVAPAIDYSAIGNEHKIFDLIYNPAKTLFLARCEEQGAECMGGMLMLQTQAIASWHIWQR